MNADSIGAPLSAMFDHSATANNRYEHNHAGPSRRALLAGMVALPLAVCPAPALAGLERRTSAELSAVIAAAGAALVAFELHRATVYDHAEEREVHARLTGDTPQPIPADVAQRDTDLLNALSAAQWEVANFPVRTPADFHAKIVFMVAHEMFDGIDNSARMLADAARLAGKEA